jgi:UDP-N-acetyl-D-galactosamine dehydrogenase
LVGGHCIGVDPYYLTHKAQALGYHPEIILSGRRLNDAMGVYIVSQLIKLMTRRRIQVDSAKVLVMGLAFKENCPDIRNTRVIDVVNELKNYNCTVDVYDPCVYAEDARREYGINLIPELQANQYDAIILAVAHSEFKQMNVSKIRSLGKENHVLYDLKYVFRPNDSDIRL